MIYMPISAMQQSHSGIEDNEFYEYGWSQRGKRLFAQGLKERG